MKIIQNTLERLVDADLDSFKIYYDFVSKFHAKKDYKNLNIQKYDLQLGNKFNRYVRLNYKV